MIVDTENEFWNGSPTRVLAKHFLGKSFISARINVLTLAGHPKGSSAQVLAKNVLFVSQCQIRVLTLEMIFGRGHPRESYVKNIFVSCYLLSDKGFDAGFNLRGSTVRVQGAASLLLTFICRKDQ